MKSHRLASRLHPREQNGGSDCVVTGGVDRMVPSAQRLNSGVQRPRLQRAPGKARREPGQASCLLRRRIEAMESRLLILNADPVYEDRLIGILDEMDGVEMRIVRSMSE